MLKNSQSTVTEVSVTEDGVSSELVGGVKVAKKPAKSKNEKKLSPNLSIFLKTLKSAS